MSLRIDTSEWISGALVIGEMGLGVLGADIPSSGTNGAGILYNDISLPSEAADEFRMLVTSVPAGGTIFFWEDSSFQTFGYADGVYSGGYDGFKNGSNYGSATYSFTIGSGIAGVTTATLANVTLSATGALALQGTTSSTLAGVTLSATGTLALAGAVSATLAAVTLAATGTLALAGAASNTLADVTSSATGTLAIVGTTSKTLADVTLSATSLLDAGNLGAVSQTLANVTASATGVVAILGSASIHLADCTIVATGTGPVIASVPGGGTSIYRRPIRDAQALERQREELHRFEALWADDEKILALLQEQVDAGVFDQPNEGLQ